MQWASNPNFNSDPWPLSRGKSSLGDTPLYEIAFWNSIQLTNQSEKSCQMAVPPSRALYDEGFSPNFKV
jgi:hypothetical protein